MHQGLKLLLVRHGDILALSLQLGDALKLLIDQLCVVKALNAHDLLHFLGCDDYSRVVRKPFVEIE